MTMETEGDRMDELLSYKPFQAQLCSLPSTTPFIAILQDGNIWGDPMTTLPCPYDPPCWYCAEKRRPDQSLPLKLR